MDEQPENQMDPEEWLRPLLAYLGDEEMRPWIVTRISQRTGVPQEEVEAILHRLAEFLLDFSRSN